MEMAEREAGYIELLVQLGLQQLVVDWMEGCKLSDSDLKKVNYQP